jgi:hypothetical protein
MTTTLTKTARRIQTEQDSQVDPDVDTKDNDKDDKKKQNNNLAATNYGVVDAHNTEQGSLADPDVDTNETGTNDEDKQVNDPAATNDGVLDDHNTDQGSQEDPDIDTKDNDKDNEKKQNNNLAATYDGAIDDHNTDQGSLTTAPDFVFHEHNEEESITVEDMHNKASAITGPDNLFPSETFDAAYFSFGTLYFCTETDTDSINIMGYFERLFVPPTIPAGTLRCPNRACPHSFASTASLLTHLGGLYSKGGPCLMPEETPKLFSTHGPIGFCLPDNLCKILKAIATDPNNASQPPLDVINGVAVRLHTNKCEWQMPYMASKTKKKCSSIIGYEVDKESGILRQWITYHNANVKVLLFKFLKMVYVEKLAFMLHTRLHWWSDNYIYPKEPRETIEKYRI